MPYLALLPPTSPLQACGLVTPTLGYPGGQLASSQPLTCTDENTETLKQSSLLTFPPLLAGPSLSLHLSRL